MMMMMIIVQSPQNLRSDPDLFHSLKGILKSITEMRKKSKEGRHLEE